MLSELRGYALAVSLCAISVPLALHFTIPSSTLMLAAMASCLFGGRKPGLLAVALSALVFDFFFLPPLHHLSIAPDSLVRFFTFVAALVLATEMINAKRRSDLVRFQSEQDFRSLAETCPECILIVDENQLIQFANPATNKLFGYSVEEVVSQPSSFLLPDLKRGQTPAGEFRALRKHGDNLDVEATCGRFGAKTTIFLRDVSDRIRAQRELEQSEENLRLMLDTIPGLVYSRSPDGTIEYVNRHTIEYFGNTFEELSHGGWKNELHPDEQESFPNELRHNVSKGKTYTMEYRRKRFDGTYRWFQTTVQPLFGPDGKVIRWYGLLTDIDDRRRMEDSLRQTQAQLSQAAQFATAAELSASIVHEISQPIAAMVANGQASLRWLAADPPNLANGMTAVERIVRDGKDARDVIKGLRTLFKRSSPQKTLLNLRQIVDEVIILVRNRIVSHGIALDMRVSEDLPAIMGDRIQLQQVLINLVSNAIEAMDATEDRPKHLSIRSEQKDQMLLIEVADTGVGIANPEKIFDAFFTTKETGMGVGLPICKSIVEAHGGNLWAENRSDGGSIFSFTLPYADPPQTGF